MIGLEILVLVLFWTWAVIAYLFLRSTLPPRLPISITPVQLGLPMNTVEFPASDGVRIAAWTITRDPGFPWIISCHGLGANRADLLDIVRGLSAAGFNLLLFDFRGHGASGGRATSFGWREQRDLEGALAFLSQHAGLPARPYGVYGVSMGAAVGLLVAARDERIGAVAADSSYANLHDALSRHLRLLYPYVPRAVFLPLVAATYRLRFGVWPHRVAPETAAGQLTNRPILVIQGGEDPRQPREDAVRLAAAAHGELWVIDGAAHLGGFGADARAYGDRLIGFFGQAIGRAVGNSV